MTAPSGEHLRRLAEYQRPKGSGGCKGRWLVLAVAALVVLACAIAVWLSIGRLAAVGADGLPMGSQLLAWYVRQRAADLTAPSTDETPVGFTIGEGDTLPQVAERLEAQGIIRDADAFRLLARVKGVDRQIQAGNHVLKRDMTADEVLDELMLGTGDVVTVTIPEGLRAEEIATILERDGVVERAEFLTAVAKGAPERTALADRPAGTGLEGYLFPDTYQFERGMAAEDVLYRLLDDFEARVLPLAQPTPAPGGRSLTERSLYDIVTLASIVEREAVLPEERGKIARVYLNRLATPPFLLDADPTVQYALGFQPEAGTWWKRPLLTADLQVDSAYNTYTNGGLPPGPIANPGLASIQAVLAPADGPWQFFVANGVACDGSHVFAETFDEHLHNIATYQTGGCGQ